MRRREGIWLSEVKQRGNRYGFLRRGHPADRAEGFSESGRWITFDTEKEARDAKREAEQHLAQALTVDEAVALYVEHLKKARRCGAKYETFLRQGLSYLFPEGAASIKTLGPRHFRTMVGTGKYAVATQKKVLSSAKTFLRWLVTEGYLKKNPLDEVKAEGRARRGKPKLRVDALKRYVQAGYELAEAGDEAAAAALTLAFVGRRPSEILKLRAQDLDEGGAVLVIDVSVAGDSLKTDDSAGGIRLDEKGWSACGPS